MPLFKASGLPLKALPYKTVEKSDEVVVVVPYTNEEGALVPEYWYGVVSAVSVSYTHLTLPTKRIV